MRVSCEPILSTYTWCDVFAQGGACLWGVAMVAPAALKFLMALIVLITINSVTRSLVSWSLTSLFSTNMAISETKLVH